MFDFSIFMFYFSNDANEASELRAIAAELRRQVERNIEFWKRKQKKKQKR